MLKHIKSFIQVCSTIFLNPKIEHFTRESDVYVSMTFDNKNMNKNAFFTIYSKKVMNWLQEC